MDLIGKLGSSVLEKGRVAHFSLKLNFNASLNFYPDCTYTHSLGTLFDKFVPRQCPFVPVGTNYKMCAQSVPMKKFLP